MDLKQKLKIIQKLEQAFIKISSFTNEVLSKNTMYCCSDCQCCIFNFITSIHKEAGNNLEIDARCYICSRGYTFTFYDNPNPFEIINTITI